GARGGAGRDGGTAGAAVVEADLDLDRGIASGVQDFPGYDDVDGRHEHLLLGCDASVQGRGGAARPSLTGSGRSAIRSPIPWDGTEHRLFPCGTNRFPSASVDSTGSTGSTGSMGSTGSSDPTEPAGAPEASAAVVPCRSPPRCVRGDARRSGRTAGPLPTSGAAAGPGR